MIFHHNTYLLSVSGYTGDLSVALEPRDQLRPASQDSIQSGEYCVPLLVLL